MTAPRPAIGDRVRVTHDGGASVLSGTVRNVAPRGLVLDVDGRFFDLHRDGWTATVLQPDEPCPGTVVLDVNGVAWQGTKRLDGLPGLLWATGARHLTSRGWSDLVEDFGPVTALGVTP